MRGIATMTRLMALAGALVMATPVTAQVMTPAAYVTAVATGDVYERTASQMVLESTLDPKVRALAEVMLRDHARSAAALRVAARRARVKVPPAALPPLQGELIAQLRSEMGTARDRAYLAQQRTAHDRMLSVQRAYAAGGTSAPLKAAARRSVPMVERHMALLKEM